MIKYVESMVTFLEIPMEVTLSLSISNCQNRCPGCHSPILHKDAGIELTDQELERQIRKNNGISCVLLLGEGEDAERIIQLASIIKTHNLKAALYSGRDEVEEDIWRAFDYVKVGRWNQALGPLNKRTTNQRLFKIENNVKIDITKRFWK